MYAIIKRKEGRYFAQSLDMSLSCFGRTREWAVEKLAQLIPQHIELGDRMNIKFFESNPEVMEALLQYCAERQKLPGCIEAEVSGIGELIAFDLTL